MRKRIRRVRKFMSENPLYVAATCVVLVEILVAVALLGDEFGDFIIDLIDFLL